MTGKTCYFTQISQYYWFMGEFGKNIKKTNIKNDVCLHSEMTQKSHLLISLPYLELSSPFYYVLKLEQHA
ncbi:TPA: hypothetical protein ACGNA4_001843, partial [Streptococcus agalactiae]